MKIRIRCHFFFTNFSFKRNFLFGSLSCYTFCWIFNQCALPMTCSRELSCFANHDVGAPCRETNKSMQMAGLPLKKMSRLIRFYLSIRISICSNRSRKKINSICIHAPVSFKGTFVQFFKKNIYFMKYFREFYCVLNSCISSQFSWI